MGTTTCFEGAGVDDFSLARQTDKENIFQSKRAHDVDKIAMQHFFFFSLLGIHMHGRLQEMFIAR